MRGATSSEPRGPTLAGTRGRRSPDPGAVRRKSGQLSRGWTSSGSRPVVALPTYAKVAISLALLLCSSLVLPLVGERAAFAAAAPDHAAFSAVTPGPSTVRPHLSPPSPAVYRALASPSQWVNISKGLRSAPPTRTSAGVAYDSKDNLYLLYGGRNGSQILSDTWEFANGQWLDVVNGSLPGPRYGAGLTYDAIQNYFVLFGGNTSTGAAYGTWLFQSGRWFGAVNGGQPKPRLFPQEAYDPAAKAVVMFGGLSVGNQSGLTWWFRGGTWMQVTPGGAGAPQHRDAATFFWYVNLTNASRSGLVLFGGQPTDPNTSTLLHDTWLYANQSGSFGWTPVLSGSSPSGRYAAAWSVDPADNRTVMFGGFNQGGGALGDTWQFNGSGWSQLTAGLARAPSARGASAMALAGAPGTPSSPFGHPAYPLLFGGGSTASVALNDTWFFGALPLAPLAPNVVVQSDVQTLEPLSVEVLGGSPNYTVAWNGLPSGCPSANRDQITCAPVQTGTVAISVTLTSGAGTVTSAQTNWTINDLPRLSQFTALPSPVALRGSATLQVGVASGSGTPPFTYMYLGLPPGCSSVNSPQVSCSPTSSGTFEIEVVVQDADSNTATGVTNLSVSSGASATKTPFWEYAIEGLALVAAILLAVVLFRSKLPHRPPSGSSPPTPWREPDSSPTSAGPARTAPPPPPGA
ncbi:MAG: hypothetical protein L3K11_06025 [Thermoplasmata archaeon]|nr:hypothetical protein [Thermoplasmata archaeon]